MKDKASEKKKKVIATNFTIINKVTLLDLIEMGDVKT